MTQAPVGMFEAVRKLVTAYSRLYILLTTDPRPEVREALREFGRCVAAVEQEAGMTDDLPEGTAPAVRVSGPVGEREVLDALLAIGGELRRTRELQEKRYADAVRMGGTRRA